MSTKSSWYHTTKGRYFTDSKNVGIDFSGGLFDQDKSRSTLIHETSHVFLCNTTENGIFLQDVEKSIEKFNFMSENEKKAVIRVIFKSQQFVQEGFSTFFQYGSLKREYTKNQLKQWHALLPDNYQEWLKPFMFSFRLSPEERDLLTQKLIGLTMNTHIRKDSEKERLLKGVENLKKYLNLPENNPNNRLSVMLKKIKKNPGILHLPVHKIPNACGLKHFEQISNQEVANFVKYISTLAGNPVLLTPDQIGKPLAVDQIFEHVKNNTIVANLNLNLAENGEFLYKINDVIHYSDIIETVFVSERGTRAQNAISVLRPLFDEEPEISFIMQTKYGEKYLYVTSKKKATKLLCTDLKNATLTVKSGDYDWKNNKIYWLDNCRSPDLVIHNHHWQLNNFFNEVIGSKDNHLIEYCNVGVREDHPFRSVITKIKEKTPIYCVNTLFPSQADEVIKTIKGSSQEVKNEFIKQNKDAINSYMVLWTGWDVRIDWVDTMLDGKELHFKQ